MTPTQREAVERLAKWHQAMADEPNRNGAKKEKHAITAALLRELAADPVVNQQLTTELAEPVAWRSKTRINDEFASGWHLTSTEPPQTPRTVAIEPLYTHPPQQRQPLTDKEIIELPAWDDYMGGCITLLDFARAVEKAHGITGEQE